MEWPRDVTPAERSSLVAGGLGWMLDAMDVMLYSLVVAHLMSDLGMAKGTAGALNSLTLLASALGGVAFGFVADRVGRTRALMVSILVYSLASGACGLSRTVFELAACRLVLGLGMGGEWTTGAALIAETWRPEHRGKALGLMQSTWAIGEMLAVGVVALVLPRFNQSRGYFPAFSTIRWPGTFDWRRNWAIFGAHCSNSAASDCFGLASAPGTIVDRLYLSKFRLGLIDGLDSMRQLFSAFWCSLA